MTAEVRLRDVTDDDLPLFFEHQLDPDATRMAAFPARDRDVALRPLPPLHLSLHLVHLFQKSPPETGQRRQNLLFCVQNAFSLEAQESNMLFDLAAVILERARACGDLCRCHPHRTTAPPPRARCRHNVIHQNGPFSGLRPASLSVAGPNLDDITFSMSSNVIIFATWLSHPPSWSRSKSAFNVAQSDHPARGRLPYFIPHPSSFIPSII